MRFFNRKGQSTLEYAVLIAGIVGAVLIFAPYVQRVAQGRFKESSDRIGYKFGGMNSTDIDLSYTTAWKEEGTSGGETETTETFSNSTGWNIESVTTSNDTVTRSESEKWGTAVTGGYIDFTK